MGEVILRKATQNDLNNIQTLVDMINEVYTLSEGNIWIDGHLRITPARLQEIIELGELLLAVKDNDHVGCIHLEPMNASEYKFKMVVVNPKYKGTGVGSLLVNFAEQEAIKMGGKLMQLELLDTTEFVHPDKVFLHNWYTRIGYKLIAEHDVDYVHNGLSKLLKTGCIAKVYQKQLIS